MPTPRSSRWVLLALPLLILLLLGGGLAALVLGVGDDEDVDPVASAPTITVPPAQGPAATSQAPGAAVAPLGTTAPAPPGTTVATAPAPAPPPTTAAPTAAAPPTTTATTPPTATPPTATPPTATPPTTAARSGATTATTASRPVSPGTVPGPGQVTRSHPVTGGGPAPWPAAAAVMAGLLVLRRRRLASA